MSDNPWRGPESGPPAPPPASGKSIINRVVEIGVVLGIIGVLIALLLPSTRTARGAARRSQCKNNLKQIALALHNYHDDFGVFPPACTVDETGRPLHSWRTLLLPYLDQHAVYNTIDLTKPWDDPANAAAREAAIHVYHCPSALPDGGGTTTYLAVVGEEFCFPPTGSRTVADFGKTSETLMIVEVDAEHAVPWMSPRDADAQRVMSFHPKGNLPHEGGVQVAFVDGGVRYVPATMPASDRLKLLTIADDGTPSDW